MATIAALTENFTGGATGAAVSTSNTIFDAISGAGTSVFGSGGVTGSKGMTVTCSANFKIHEADFTATPVLWFVFDFYIESVFTSATAWLQAWDTNAATNKILDVRQAAGARQLQLRDVNSTVWTSGTLEDSWYRLYVYMKVDATKRIRAMLYSTTVGGQEFLVEDSGEIVSNTLATSCGHIRIGSTTSSIGGVSIARLRGDTATQPANDPLTWSRPLTDGIVLSDSVALDRSLDLSDNSALSDTVMSDLQRLEGWIYGKAVRIGG